MTQTFHHQGQPKTKASQIRMVEKINRRFEPGDKMNVRMDDGSIVEWTMQYPASILGGHTAVIWCKEHSSCYLADRVVF